MSSITGFVPGYPGIRPRSDYCAHGLLLDRAGRPPCKACFHANARAGARALGILGAALAGPAATEAAALVVLSFRGEVTVEGMAESIRSGW